MRAHIKPYELTMSEVVQSGSSCVLIDDSGTPGQNAGSKYLHPERKTWVAVLVSHKQMSEVCEQIRAALKEVTTQTGASEFHFKDIYQGSGQFKSVEFKIRLALFAFMHEIFIRYMFPVIVQTFDPMDLSELRSRAVFPNKIGSFDLTKASDMALFFLLVRVKWFIKQNLNDFNTPCFAVIDEGFRPAGRSIKIHNWDRFLHNSSIYTEKSSTFLPIQLADYASFCIARSQWLLNKEKISRSDAVFVEFIADIRTNIVNLPESVIDLNNWSPTDYGRLIELDRKSKGLAPKHN